MRYVFVFACKYASLGCIAVVFYHKSRKYGIPLISESVSAEGAPPGDAANTIV